MSIERTPEDVKRFTDEMEAIRQPQPGDMWRHDAWPTGTPCATVGKVEMGVVTWARGKEGMSQTPNILVRHLRAEYGWRRA